MAITDYFVDPAINADSGTGTLGDPFGDLQYALNTVTRNATDGDRMNVKAGTAEVLAAALSLATYGTPTNGAPLVIQGYTAAQGDGGIGEINNGGANVGVYTAAANSVSFVDMKLGNCGTAQIVNVGTNSMLLNCEFLSSSNFAAVQVGNNSHLARCKFNSTLSGTHSLRLDTGGAVVGCYFAKTSNNCILGGGGGKLSQCIFSLSGSATGVTTTSGMAFFLNSFYGGGGTGTGIIANGVCSIFNNIFAGFSGVGAEGILISATTFTLQIFGANGFYNNTTNISGTEKVLYRLPDITLTVDPFTNAAGGDFSVGAEAQAAGWPPDFLAISTEQFLDIGAAQIEPEEAGAAALVGGGLVH